METKQHSFSANFLVGATSSAIARTTMAPHETMMTQIPNLSNDYHKELTKQGREYGGTSLSFWFKRAYSLYGFSYFWRGNLKGILLRSPQQALNFALKDESRAILGVLPSTPFSSRIFPNVSSGAIAGGLTALMFNPFWTARGLVLNQNSAAKYYQGPSQFTGTLDAIRKSVTSKGIRAIYPQFGLRMAQEMVYRGLFFGLYDSFRPSLTRLEKYPPVLFVASFFMGWATTYCAIFASYPIGTLCRRVAMYSEKRSSMHVLREILANEGLRGLTKFAGGNVLVPLNGAIMLACYDQLQLAFKNYAA